MKSLVCEICGGNELVKQNDLYVCPYCGTKYTAEDAKKLIVEGKVDISGSAIKIDRTDELEKLYQAAHNARKISDYKTAIRHYETISAKDPNSWEAIFYLVILRTNDITNGEIYSAACNVENCLQSVIELICENIENSDEQKKAILEVVDQTKKTTSWLNSASLSYFSSLSNSNNIPFSKSNIGEFQECKKRCVKIAYIPLTLANTIIKLCNMEDNDYKNCVVGLYEKIININNEYKRKFKQGNLFSRAFLNDCNEVIGKYTLTAENNPKKSKRSMGNIDKNNSDLQRKCKIISIVSIVMGVYSIGVSALVEGGFILSIVSLGLAIYAKKKTSEDSSIAKISKAGIIVSSISIGLSILLTLVMFT